MRNRTMHRFYRHAVPLDADLKEFEGATPLSLLKEGDYFVIKGFNNRCPFLSNRLLSMGLCPGTIMKIQKRDPGGHLIVELGNARIGLGGGEALGIFVEKRLPEKKESDNEDSSSI